jgi:proteasome lid subunit RPN8/RPN11
LKITKEASDAIVAHAREALPDECCGLLIGSPSLIERAHRARNLDASPTRFLIDPRDHFAAIHAARAIGLDVVGVYHSHPATSATPSPADLAEASYPEYIYVIVSPQLEPIDVRSFRLRDGGVVEERLDVSGQEVP